MLVSMNYKIAARFDPFSRCFLQDDDDNITRFLILAREPIIPGTDRPYKVLLPLYLLML